MLATGKENVRERGMLKAKTKSKQKPSPGKTTVVVYLRVSVKTRDALVAKAVKQQRSVNWMGAHLLERALGT